MKSNQILAGGENNRIRGVSFRSCDFLGVVCYAVMFFLIRYSNYLSGKTFACDYRLVVRIGDFNSQKK